LLSSEIIIPIIVSFITALATIKYKSNKDDLSHKNKLKFEHSLSEQKKIKESISKNKIQMINACEMLNHRLWNLSEFYEKKWHFVDGDFTKETKYYFHSFIYRLGAIIWWSSKIENELIYLDTTIADKDDLDFLKFCKFIHIILSQVKLFNNLDYNGEKDYDHFFYHKLIKEINCLSNENKTDIINYDLYEKDLTDNLEKMKGICSFIDGVHPKEDRLRWNRLYALHLTIIAFLNNYGYDFQKTSKQQIEEIVKVMSLSENNDTVLLNFVQLLQKIKLDKNKEVQKIQCVINKSAESQLHCDSYSWFSRLVNRNQ